MLLQTIKSLPSFSAGSALNLAGLPGTPWAFLTQLATSWWTLSSPQGWSGRSGCPWRAPPPTCPCCPGNPISSSPGASSGSSETSQNPATIAPTGSAYSFRSEKYPESVVYWTGRLSFHVHLFSCPTTWIGDMRVEGCWGLRPDIALDEVVRYPDFLVISSSHPGEATQPPLHQGLGPVGGVWTLQQGGGLWTMWLGPGWIFWTQGLEPGWVFWTHLLDLILGPHNTCGLSLRWWHVTQANNQVRDGRVSFLNR